MNTIQDERSGFFHRLLTLKLWLDTVELMSEVHVGWSQTIFLFSSGIFWRFLWRPSHHQILIPSTEKQWEQGFTIGYLRKMITTIRGRELDNLTTIFASIYGIYVSKCTWGGMEATLFTPEISTLSPKGAPMVTLALLLGQVAVCPHSAGYPWSAMDLWWSARSLDNKAWSCVGAQGGPGFGPRDYENVSGWSMISVNFWMVPSGKLT